MFGPCYLYKAFRDLSENTLKLFSLTVIQRLTDRSMLLSKFLLSLTTLSYPCLRFFLDSTIVIISIFKCQSVIASPTAAGRKRCSSVTNWQMQVRHHISPIDFRTNHRLQCNLKLWKKTASSHKDLPNIRHLKPHRYSLAFKSVRIFVISYSRNKEKTFLTILSCCSLIYHLIILHIQHFGQQPLLYVLYK